METLLTLLEICLFGMLPTHSSQKRESSDKKVMDADFYSFITLNLSPLEFSFVSP